MRFGLPAVYRARNRRGRNTRILRVMAVAYEMPEGTIPILARNFQYINDLPGIHNYLAYLNGEPVGCMSLFSYMGYGALGGGGVIPVRAGPTSPLRWRYAAIRIGRKMATK